MEGFKVVQEGKLSVKAKIVNDEAYVVVLDFNGEKIEFPVDIARSFALGILETCERAKLSTELKDVIQLVTKNDEQAQLAFKVLGYMEQKADNDE